MASWNPERVTELVREVAADELVPRFRRLAAHEVFSKATAEDPDDIVTEADLAVERRLGPALAALLPGSVVLGEEAAAGDPSLRGLLDGDRPTWIVDPLDGTRNFAAASADFGVIVALCAGGVVTHGWIHLPVADRTLVAERGAGAWESGVRLAATRPPRAGEPLRGTVYTRFMPAALRLEIEARARATALVVEGTGCAAVEYALLVEGAKDFVLYYRLLPWDHAAGGLVLDEAGGAARRPDGRPYRATDRDPLCLATHLAADWPAARAAVLGLGEE
jgi:fructose-1,6-bisphosphatase/inositol monophosphatase family enzyme